MSMVEEDLADSGGDQQDQYVGDGVVGMERRRNPLIVKEEEKLDRLGLKDDLWLKRLGFEKKYGSMENYWRERKELASPIVDRNKFFMPLEAKPIFENEDDEKKRIREIKQELNKHVDPDYVHLREGLSKPSPGEIERLKTGDLPSPSDSYADPYLKAAGDLCDRDFLLPAWWPHAVPMEEWEWFGPGADDLEDDLKAYLEEEQRLDGLGVIKKSKTQEAGIDEYNINASTGKAESRMRREDDTGRDKTPFFQLSFVRTGLAYATGFTFGGLIGCAATYQVSDHLTPPIRRSAMFNSFLQRGTQWGNKFGVLGFLYSASYITIRDQYYASNQFRGQPGELEKEYFIIHTAAGSLTGLLFGFSTRNRRATLVSTAIGGISMALATNPFKIPKFSEYWNWALSLTAGTPQKGQLFKPLGMEPLPEDKIFGKLPEDLLNDDDLE